MENITAPAKRFAELDFARALPLLGLPFVHFFEDFSGVYTADAVGAAWGNVFLRLCMIGPSVFMICLGMNVVFSSQSTPKKLAARGLTILGLSYALNLIRSLIPGALTLLAGYTEPWSIALKYFITSDILFFAGAAFLFFALMKNLRARPFYILLISLALLTVNTLISQPVIPGEYLSRFLGNFFYVDEFSCFPFLSWIIFPSIGYCLGLLIKNLRDDAERREFFLRMLLGGGVGFAAVWVCLSSYGLDPLLIAVSPINDYITDLANVALDVSISCAWFGAAYFIYGLIRAPKVRRATDKVSQSILVFYCVQWALVSWLWYGLFCCGLYEQPVFSEAGFILTAVGIFAVSVAVALLIQRKIDGRKKLVAKRGEGVIL